MDLFSAVVGPVRKKKMQKRKGSPGGDGRPPKQMMGNRNQNGLFA